VTQQLLEKLKVWFSLTLMSVAALLVHGYHPSAEDGEIYLPGVEKLLNPHLFPQGSEFFQSHASMTLFPNLVAVSLRVTHLPFEIGLLLWHFVSILLFLRACWELSCLLFPNTRARWVGVGLVASLLTIPVSGTALYIMDQYLNPRNLAAFAAVFAVARFLEKKYGFAILWVIFAGSVHPLMWVFPCSFCVLWIAIEKFDSWCFAVARPTARAVGAGALSAMWMPLALQSSPAYHEAAKLHAYHYIQNWAWYELLGIVGPLIIFWWLGRVAQSRQWVLLGQTCRAFVIYGTIYLALAVIVDLPAKFESLARIQPLRSLHLEYILLFLIMGGFIGEYLLKGYVWRHLVLFLPLISGMYIAQRSLFPASAHLEWPGRAPQNPWGQAFTWIRQNTPPGAVFAIDPGYMQVPGEDQIGFRCLAQRSRLADDMKDNGAVSMFPLLAGEWAEQIEAQTPWKSLQADDFARLKTRYGVNWVVMQQPGISGLDCAYQNQAVRVCRVD
jgi:hypothetical protein